MAGPNKHKCSFCPRKVPVNAKQLICDCCSSFIHKNCSNLLKKELDEIISNNRPWSCLYCNEINFPFNNILDEDTFYTTIQISEKHNDTANTSDKLFVPFEINDNDYIHQDSDSDPDFNYYNQEQIISNLNSKYYLKKNFSEYVLPTYGKDKECMSLIHFNIRSAQANLKYFEAYLCSLNFSFNCIGLTETWFKESNSDVHNILGYNKIDRIRQCKQGGGVSILLKEGILFKERHDLSTVTDDIECVFVEATIVKKILIGVIYRPPDRKISDFNKHLKKNMNNVNVTRMPCYLMGDTNINVINHTTHKETSDYLDLMYSYGLVPVINRPTRVTDHSASLIDHIFPNNFTATTLN